MIKIGTEVKKDYHDYEAKYLVALRDMVIFETGQGRSIMDGLITGINERGLHVRLLSLDSTIFVKWCNVREIIKKEKK